MEKPVVRLGAGAIVVDGSKLLLGRRQVDNNRGKWELLGGLVEPGESLPEAVKRHAREEAAIEVEPLAIVAHYMRDFPERNVRNVGFCYVCRLVEGEARDTERVKDHRWVVLDRAFEEDLTEFTRLQLEQYRDWLETVMRLAV